MSGHVSAADSVSAACERYEGLLDSAGLRRRPVAVLDLDAFDANAASLAERAGKLPVRVASKSLRVQALVDRAVRRFRGGILAFSLREALDFIARVHGNVVVGYPCVDSAALVQLAHSESARSSITLMIDSIAHVRLIEEVCGPYLPQGARIRVALELDCSYAPARGVWVGARRSPLLTPSDIERCARAVIDSPCVRLVGLMGYEGQIAGVGNAGRTVRAAIVRGMQRLSAKDVAARRCEAVTRVRALAPLEFVNGGGTGSLESTSQDASVTEVAAGSGLIGPAIFDNYTAFTPRPALVLGFPVVRRPSADIATLLGGGWIASGPPGADRLPVPVHPRGLTLLGMEGAGEVQTPVRGQDARSLTVGDTVWMRHAKAGEPAEHIDSYVLVSSRGIEDVVPTYRGEGRTYI